MKHTKLTIVVEYDYDEDEIHRGSGKVWGDGFADGCVDMVSILADHTEKVGKGVYNVTVSREDA